jgi:hypothetical protein
VERAGSDAGMQSSYINLLTISRGRVELSTLRGRVSHAMGNKTPLDIVLFLPADVAKSVTISI